MKSDQQPLDLVYTWVDDRWPGYRDLLGQYATNPQNLDPARTRDNLDLLRYSFRSVEKYWRKEGRIFLVTCRPQIPAWLNTKNSRLVIVHHDDFMPKEVLPTFNSFAIVGCLHMIKGISREFVHFDDDTLLLSHVSRQDFLDEEGRLRVFPWKYRFPKADELTTASSAWNHALATSKLLLDQKFGAKERDQSFHTPYYFNVDYLNEMYSEFAETWTRTINSKFRRKDNIPPDFFYHQYLLETARAVSVSKRESRWASGYVPLEDFWPLTALALLKLNLGQKKWCTFNDNLGAKPSAVTEYLARRQLNYWFPEPSSFEI